MLPGDWRKEIEDTANEATRRVADESNRRNTEQNSILSARIDCVAYELKRYNDKQEKEEPKKRCRENLTIGSLIFAAIFTGGLAIFSACQLHEMQKVYGPIKDQAKAVKDAAEVAEKTLIATERPWIDIKNLAVEDICVDVNGARVIVEFDMTNMGHSPALRVEPWTASTVNLQGAPDQSNLFTRPTVGIRDLREPDTLFPGNTPHRKVSAYVSNSQLKWLQEQNIKLFSVRTDVCVDYIFSGSSVPHQTCYSLTLVQKPTGQIIGTIPTPQTCIANVGYSYGGPGQSLAN